MDNLKARRMEDTQPTRAERVYSPKYFCTMNHCKGVYNTKLEDLHKILAVRTQTAIRANWFSWPMNTNEVHKPGRCVECTSKWLNFTESSIACCASKLIVFKITPFSSIVSTTGVPYW